MIEKTRCTGCTACEAICPVDAITMQRDEKGFLVPVIDEAMCIGCDMCEEVCPVPKQKTGDTAPLKAACYAACTKDEAIREKSSSGGIFTQLAQSVLKEKGAVVGCAMQDDCRSAQHVVITKEEELKKLQGSKYVQSDLNTVLRQVKELLESGRKVLFAGTPCQVAGLKDYLGANIYENLLLVDVICHGVPSPFIWEQYVAFRQQQEGSQAKKVSFRDKSLGWNQFSMRFQYENGTEYTQPLSKDLYLQGFLKNLTLRDCCYHCSFKGNNSQSDIMLGDFWGIEYVLPQWKDDKGTSMVLVKTQKGEAAWQAIGESVRQEKLDINRVIQYNSALTHSVAVPKKREKFWHSCREESTEEALRKYTAEHFGEKAFKKAAKRTKQIAKKCLKILTGKK